MQKYGTALESIAFQLGRRDGYEPGNIKQYHTIAHISMEKHANPLRFPAPEQHKGTLIINKATRSDYQSDYQRLLVRHQGLGIHKRGNLRKVWKSIVFCTIRSPR